MSLGLRLLAHFSAPPPLPDGVIVQIETWIRQSYTDMIPETRQEVVDSSPTLFCKIHPGAEEFEIAIVGSDRLVASANTSTLGPGYHAFVTGLLKGLAVELDLTWDSEQEDSDEYGDETGFFFTGDRGALQDEMTGWLAAVAGTFFDGSLDSHDVDIALCLPWNPRFEAGQQAITALGPRDREWLRRTARHGESGSDFFAWWNFGFDAEYYLRRALTQMWTDVRWRFPIKNSETMVLDDVATCLTRAYELDPSLHYPWAEWKQVLLLLDRGGPQFELVNAQAHEAPIIGYRRANVVVSLPGQWTIRIPGSFSNFEADDTGDLSAMDPPREIWFTAYRLEDNSPVQTFHKKKKEMQQDRSAEFRFDHDDCFGKAAITTKTSENGEPYFILNSSIFSLGMRAVCTIVFFDPEQLNWAVTTWQSIQPPSPDDPV